MIIAFPVYAHIPSYVGNLVVRDLVGVGPLRVYHYFPVDSDLLIPERSNAQPTSVPSNIIHINSINENNLAILDAENFYQMLQNSPNISKEEIVSLWRLFTSNHVNKDVKLLFYDFISFENPDYLTHDIIKQAKKEKEKGEVRHKLLVALQYIYQKNWKKMTKQI
ncbi:MAG: hypothetical protein CK424_03270 [Legionella sp.]|nr:MAG: hypothetical protein CK424_03270 [Legionella sp.]